MIVALFRIELGGLRQNTRRNESLSNVVQDCGLGDLLQSVAVTQSQPLGKDHRVAGHVGHVRECVEVVPGQTIQIVRQHVAGSQQRRELAAQLFSHRDIRPAVDEPSRMFNLCGYGQLATRQIAPRLALALDRHEDSTDSSSCAPNCVKVIGPNINVLYPTVQQLGNLVRLHGSTGPVIQHRRAIGLVLHVQVGSRLFETAEHVHLHGHVAERWIRCFD